MSTRKLVAVCDSREGYNRLAKEYKQYHSHLDSFDKGVFTRFLPRQKTALRVLDLGAGDGRMYKYFKDPQLASYTACDIAEKLLARHPKGQKVQTVVCDLNQDRPLTQTFDVIICFFVIEHLEDMQHFFAQCDKVLVPGGRVIIGHFVQRREVTFKHEKDLYKIERTNWRIEDICEAGQESFFSLHVEEIREKNVFLGYVIVGEKK